MLIFLFILGIVGSWAQGFGSGPNGSALIWVAGSRFGSAFKMRIRIQDVKIALKFWRIFYIYLFKWLTFFLMKRKSLYWTVYPDGTGSESGSTSLSVIRQNAGSGFKSMRIRNPGEFSKDADWYICWLWELADFYCLRMLFTEFRLTIQVLFQLD